MTAKYLVQIDWDNDGTFTEAGEDVTARVLARTELTIQYGRDQARSLNPPMVGTASLELDNNSRDYSPGNASSPLAGNLKPGRPLRIQAVHNGTTYTLYRGFLDDYAISPKLEERSVKFGALDGLVRLHETKLSTQLYEGVRTGTAMGYILDAAGWPVGDRDLDPGATIIRYWWEEGTSAYDAMMDLLESEGPPSLVHIEPSTGFFTFHDRHHRLFNTASTTSQATFRDDGAEPRYTQNFAYDIGWRDVVNKVSFSVDEREPSSPAVVWESERSTYSLGASASTTIVAEASDPFIAAVVPVSGTDYQLRSGSVTVTLSRTSGQSTTITLTAGGSGCRITDLRLRATPISVKRTLQANASDSASITQHGERAYSGSAKWADINDAKAIADLIVLHRKEPLATVQMPVQSTNVTRLTQQLTRKISDRVAIVEPETGLDGDHFYVEQVQHTLAEGGLKTHTTQFGLEQVPAGLPAPSSVFRFDTAGQGFDQGGFAT